MLEDGITVELSSTGSYRPGQWWQYEARVGNDNANGPWRPEPHGPERRFAPLALLQFVSAAEPLRLLAWLDERFSHPCDLDADDIAFAGARVGSASDTVQEAIEELFERPIHIGTCTITVTPGDDLDAAVAALPAEGGELCFEAGTYPLRAPLVIRGRTRVVVHGAGPATRIRALATEAALVFENCSEIAVRSLRVEGGLPETAAAREHLNGAITFVGGGEVSVSDCVLSCPDAQADATGDIRRGQTCLTARGDAEPLRVRVEQNRFDVGTLQTGVLLVDPAHAYVAGNRVRVAGARDLATGRVADEGIVVAGRTVGTVEILDNLVEQTIQGIHIAASGPAAGRESADAVLVSRNVVHARVPAAHNRGRHAVFVGNARSVHVKDTIATLERTGQQAPTPVDAIRLHGAFGPFVAVRQTSARNFTTGVRVEPLDPVPSPRMWLVSETMADGGALGAEVPESVQHERNYPEHAVVAILSLVPAHGHAQRGRRAHDHGHRSRCGRTADRRRRDPLLSPRPCEQSAGASGDDERRRRRRAHLHGHERRPRHDQRLRRLERERAPGRNRALDPCCRRLRRRGPANVQLAQNAASSLRGSATVITATVRTASGAPSPDARVVFVVTGANARAAQAVLANAAGQAVFTYTGPNPGTDVIRAFVDLNGNNQRDAGEPEQTISHVYTAPVAAAVTLLPTGGVAPSRERAPLARERPRRRGSSRRGRDGPVRRHGSESALRHGDVRRERQRHVPAHRHKRRNGHDRGVRRPQQQCCPRRERAAGSGDPNVRRDSGPAADGERAGSVGAGPQRRRPPRSRPRG